jgi:hypothetical protein
MLAILRTVCTTLRISFGQQESRKPLFIYLISGVILCALLKMLGREHIHRGKSFWKCVLQHANTNN